jgi:hypothetical protein
LAAIKKFIPVRDSFRDNLQARQQAKLDFTADTEKLFAPITTATGEVVTAIKESKPDVAPEVTPEVKPEEKKTKKIVNRYQGLRDKFTE